MKNVVFWDTKTQLVLHRRHITSPLEPSQLMLCKIQVFMGVTMKNVVLWDIKTQFAPYRKHVTSPLRAEPVNAT
jgi:hypothetical protein